MDTTPTDALISQLDRLAGEFAAAIAPLEDEQAMRATQAQFLGKKGKLFHVEGGDVDSRERAKEAEKEFIEDGD